MMRYQRNYRYIDKLDDIVVNYNTTLHRSLENLAPNDVNKENEADIWADLYLKKHRWTKVKPTFKFKLGDLVRISVLKQPFEELIKNNLQPRYFVCQIVF